MFLNILQTLQYPKIAAAMFGLQIKSPNIGSYPEKNNSIIDWVWMLIEPFFSNIGCYWKI